MKVEQLTSAIGAEVTGVRLVDAARDDDLFATIKTALLQHKVLFLRNQDISRADHVAFARRFGELEDHPVAGNDPDQPGLVRIYKTPDAPNYRYENSWHSDGTWREAPAMGCMECPTGGGRHHVGQHGTGPRATTRNDQAADRRPARAPRHRCTFSAAMPIERRLALKAQFHDAEQPVVRTHPETGEKVLFVNGFTTHFTNFHTPDNVRHGQDFTQGTSAPLQYLIGQAAIPEYQVRWRPNSVAI